MEGIKYVIDREGNKSAVQIDLKIWSELWEDMSDIITSKQRRKERKTNWRAIKKDIVKNS